MSMNFQGALTWAGAVCVSVASAGAQTSVTYVASLHPMNANVTGSETSGRAQFTVKGGTLTIDINVKGVPPDMIHWQHFHGFKNSRDAACPMQRRMPTTTALST